MKVSKWVDFGQEIEIEIGTDDVRAALAESFQRVTSPGFEEEPPPDHAVRSMLSTIASFLKALTDEQIAASLSEPARKTVHNFLVEQTARFAPLGTPGREKP
jgi:hypothetical protein